MLNLTIEPRVEYLYAHITGDFDLEISKNITAQIYEAAKENNLSKIFADFSEVQTPLSFSERLEYVQFLADENLKYILHLKADVKIAYLLSPQTISPDKFGETYAINRAVSICADTNRDKCLEWLEIEQE